MSTHDHGSTSATRESDADNKDTVSKEDIGRSETTVPTAQAPEADEFGLPSRPLRRRQYELEEEEVESSEDEDRFEDARSERGLEKHEPLKASSEEQVESEYAVKDLNKSAGSVEGAHHVEVSAEQSSRILNDQEGEGSVPKVQDTTPIKNDAPEAVEPPQPISPQTQSRPRSLESSRSKTKQVRSPESPVSPRVRRHRTNSSLGSPGGPAISEWSHQQLAPREEEEVEESNEGEWQDMPAFATHRIYDDWGKVLAKEYGEEDHEYLTYSNLGGAGKGYTRVQVDEDAQSATSLDDTTAYLFKDPTLGTTLMQEDDEGRDLVSQMETTKELLTEGQRVAYVGVVRLSIARMLADVSQMSRNKATKKIIEFATESMKMWGQKMMVRLYAHMEISSQEQVMVEQLTVHGVLTSDLAPALMQNARVKNPQASPEAAMARSETSSISSARPSMNSPRPPSYYAAPGASGSSHMLSPPITPATASAPNMDSPPAYQQQDADDFVPQDISKVDKKNLDLDIRWTVLCDLFLLLIADSAYDARSRVLLEHVGEALDVEWTEICRFEKRVTDALEMQEQADKENWNEDEHLEARKKAASKKRMMVMGLCTVGGGLIIGLSAGLLAPVIGAGLAAGFTTIGVAGTSSFLGGAGAAALIGTTGAAAGGFVGGKASNRRTGAVKTFEYRPLFNNKRPNLIVSVAGWMTGKVDDVRLPFSTINPIMGDIYSVNWEPDMLQSTGQTIQILATEALTQTIQQILGATILTALMAGLNIPIVLTKLAYLIDNPWAVSLARADATGLILADSLIDRNLGIRPITLVGFSLGSRVIFSCLKELARRGACGIVQNVYMFGSPVVVKQDEWIRARTIVSGRFVNGYATNDWILGYLFRATSGGILRVSGLANVNVAGIDNKDVTDLVPGHMAYRGMMPTLLMEVGWLVDSPEFTEIEDPDPDNHEQRQRELLDEIEAARAEVEEKQKNKKGASGGFRSFFSRKKAVKKEWETYDERSQRVLEGDENAAEEVAAEASWSGDVMFDVDAIRREALTLAVEEGADINEIKSHLQIREIQSTMPALKITDSHSSASGNTNGWSNGSVSKRSEAQGSKKMNKKSDKRASTLFSRSDEPRSVKTNGASSQANGYFPTMHDQDADDGIRLSFEPSSTTNPVYSFSSSPTHSSAPNLSRPADQRSTSLKVATPPPRTSIYESQAAARADTDHNPWSANAGAHNHDYEDLFQGEGEVSMSFE